MVVKGRNDLSAAFAILSALMGYADQQDFRLVEEPAPPALTAELDGLVAEALRERPEVISLRYKRNAAVHNAQAERALRYPTINALGAAGVNPEHGPDFNDYHLVGGVAMTMPLFDGFRIDARGAQAELQACQVEQDLRALTDTVSRDVRLAWFRVNDASQRLEITARMLEHARLAFDLAQAYYNAGSSSIVELNLAELGYVTAAISRTTAQYDYLIRRADLDYQVGQIR